MGIKKPLLWCEDPGLTCLAAVKAGDFYYMKNTY